MVQQKDKVIVLRAVQFEERHRVVTGLSENHGVVSAMARNSIQSRRFGGCLDLFAASIWQWVQRPEGGDLVRLEMAESLKSFTGIQKDYDRLVAGSFLVELVLRGVPGGTPVPDLFKALSNALVCLDESQVDYVSDLVQIIFILRFAVWSGHSPQLSRCSICLRPVSEDLQKPGVVGEFKIGGASFVCESCISGSSSRSDVQSLKAVELAHLILFLNVPIRKAVDDASLDATSLQHLTRLVHRYMDSHLPGLELHKFQSLRQNQIEGAWNE